MRADQAIALGDEILRLIEDDVPEAAFDKAGEFFESVGERTKAIQETIARTGEATDNQVTALENMESAVSRWIR
jgi:hypothetical protein